LLARVSAIKLVEMKFQSWPSGRFSDATARRVPARQISAHPIQSSPIQTHPILARLIPTRTILAQIEVHGHRHALACELYSDGDPSRLRAALRESQAFASPVHSDATPILIAPYLCPEAQELCKQSKAGFLDFQGNARLTVGEVFIVMRSLPGRATAPQFAALRPRDVILSEAHLSGAEGPASAFRTSRSSSMPIVATASPVPSQLPAISHNRVGSVAIPA
jgi:hypothetical protein